MRDIRFRAWDKVDCIMSSMESNGVFRRSFKGESTGVMQDVGLGLLVKRANNGKTILMQYTGLADKNGKPIFEGDILKWHKDDTQISATVFHEFAFYHLFDGIHEDFCFDDGKLCEVIGNVHENHELLDKQT